ncbi:alpha carbonic anhydrase 4-like [Populus alba x Populus x berolinensis]|nr:alpha carbonic anhydrase 4-like [Populus alba x Populus x berolinensis]
MDLSVAGAGGAACFTALAAASGRELIGFEPATNDTTSFSYIEATGRGPSKWGQLDPKWKACGDGKSQSPIDLLDQNVKVLYGQEDQLRRDYKPANATIISRGRDILVSWKGDAGKISINGTDYNLQGSHWHVPSEHTFNFKKYDMELHIVHVNSLGETAVVGVLYKYGKPDPFISKLFPYIKSVTKQEKSLGIFSPNNMVFGSRKLYRYIGSLSVPPCSEGVIWTVVKKVRTVSREQVQLLRDVVDYGYQANARPVQPLNGRAVNLFIRPSKNL